MEGKGNFIVGFRRSIDDDSLVVVFLFSFLILVSRSSLTTQRINMRCVFSMSLLSHCGKAPSFMANSSVGHPSSL